MKIAGLILRIFAVLVQFFAFMHYDPTSAGIRTGHQRMQNAEGALAATIIRNPIPLFTTSLHLTNQTA